LKAHLPSDSTEAGRQIDFNDEHLENASASIRVSFDPDSNVNDDSDQHNEKASSPRNSTEAGRQIDLNEKQLENAFASIRVSLHPDSKNSEQTDLHSRKLSLRRISISAFNVTLDSPPK
jgi:hypothetical protein